MAVNITEVLQTAAASAIQRHSESSGAFLQVLDRAFLQKNLEVDPVQAAAIRQIMSREAPIGPTVPE